VEKAREAAAVAKARTMTTVQAALAEAQVQKGKPRKQVQSRFEFRKAAFVFNHRNRRVADKLPDTFFTNCTCLNN
jgi:hypothetical protein